MLVDPSLSFGSTDDLGCYVTNPGTGAPPSDPKVCAGQANPDTNLSYGHTAYLRRIYLRFGDLTDGPAALPPDSTVTNADLVMTEAAASVPTASLDTEVLAVGSSWTSSSISWAAQPTTSTTQSDHLSVTPPGVASQVTFNPTSLVQSIVHGDVPNDGVAIRMVNEGVAPNTITFHGVASDNGAPMLNVTWTPVVGQQGFIGAYDHQLSDRSDLHVDLADRNLVVNGTDESMTGPGQSLLVRRTFNSQTAADVGNSNSYGVGWTMSGGADTGIAIGRQTVAVTRPGGAVGTFSRNFAQSSTTVSLNDGNLNGPSWFTAPGWKADLTQPDRCTTSSPSGTPTSSGPTPCSRPTWGRRRRAAPPTATATPSPIPMSATGRSRPALLPRSRIRPVRVRSLWP